MVIVGKNSSKSTKGIEGLEQKIKAFGAKLTVTGQKSTYNSVYLYVAHITALYTYRHSK